MKYIVRMTDQTRQAIKDQAIYIAEDCQAPENAVRWLKRVNEGIDSLAEWPRRCSRTEEDKYRPYEIRKLNIGGYFLVFTPDDERQTVWIISFRHGRMKPKIDDLPRDIPIEDGDK